MHSGLVTCLGVCLDCNKWGFLLFMSFATILFSLVPFLLSIYRLFIYVTIITVYIFINNHMYYHISLCIFCFGMKCRMQCDIVHHSKHVKVASSMIIFFGLSPLIEMQTWKYAVIAIGSKEIIFIFKDIFIQGTLYLSFWFPWELSYRTVICRCYLKNLIF